MQPKTLNINKFVFLSSFALMRIFFHLQKLEFFVRAVTSIWSHFCRHPISGKGRFLFLLPLLLLIATLTKPRSFVKKGMDV